MNWEDPTDHTDHFILQYSEAGKNRVTADSLRISDHH